jgi:integrase/recombinase XerD
MDVVPAADRFLRNARFGQHRAESTTKAYATSVALFLRWCEQTGRDWTTAAPDAGLFITWLKFTPAQAGPGTVVLPGPGTPPVRGERRINGILATVRGFLAFGVAGREVPGWVLGAIVSGYADRAHGPDGWKRIADQWLQPGGMAEFDFHATHGWLYSRSQYGLL